MGYDTILTLGLPWYNCNTLIVVVDDHQNLGSTILALELEAEFEFEAFAHQTNFLPI